MFSPITLDALRVLDAIERRRSFAAAADELYRVPSAISYTVNKLEQELGVELFDRSRRKAELTSVGRLVLEQGRQILTATEELTARARLAADGWEAELRICVGSVLAYDSVYPLIAEFQAAHPKTEIRLSEEVLAGAWDALNSERCDLLIGGEGEPIGQGLVTHELGRVVFEFVVAAGHPLTLLAQPIPLAAIYDYPIVVAADSSRGLPVRSSGLFDGRSRIVVPSVERKIEAQLKGLGVGYLPLHRIKHELDAGTLQIIALQEPDSAQVICAAWRHANRGKALKWFIKRLKNMHFDAQRGLV